MEKHTEVHFFRGGGKSMIKRKGSRLRRAAAVLLSAMLIAGLLSDTVPVNVLAKETVKPSVQTQEQEDGGTSVPKVSEEKQETEPAGEGSVTEPETKPGQDMETDPEEDETEPGEGNITEPGQETEKEPGEETGSEETEGNVPEEPDEGTGKEPDDETDQTEQETPGTDIEGEKESETVSGNNLESETMARPQGVMRASKVSARDGEIASGTDWVLDADGKLTISSDTGMIFWREAFLSEEQDQLADQVQKIVIQDTVSSIEERAFVNCSSLTDIVIPESVTSIGACAFGDCSSLSQIIIPEKVTDIEEAAFMGCSSLTEITIPASVEGIGNSAFIGCSKLQKITMRGETPPAIGDNDHAQSLFYGCQFFKERQQGIYVPDGRADAYRNTPGWNVWAEFIADDKVPAEKHEHDGVTYIPWTKTDSLPTDAGNYYLTENVTLSYGRTVPEGMTSLCLNGKNPSGV